MRVLSLLPSATEIVAALGAVDALVGVSHACDYPARVAALPRVTGSGIDPAALPGAVDREVRRLAAEGASLYTLDEVRIRDLSPDVILTQALCDVCAVREGDVRALAARMTPVPRVLALSASTLEGVLDDILAIGAALGADDEAEELRAGLHARMRTVHDALKRRRAPRRAVVVVEWTDPVFAGGHWVPDMVRRAGGHDLFGEAGRHSETVSVEQIRAAEPEIVLVAPCGYDLAMAEREARGMITLGEWSFPAHVAVWALDANALTSRPGPRVVDGVEVMARIFNPDVFSPLVSGRAVRVR